MLKICFTICDLSVNLSNPFSKLLDYFLVLKFVESYKFFSSYEDTIDYFKFTSISDFFIEIYLFL